MFNHLRPWLKHCLHFGAIQVKQDPWIKARGDQQKWLKVWKTGTQSLEKLGRGTEALTLQKGTLGRGCKDNEKWDLGGRGLFLSL